MSATICIEIGDDGKLSVGQEPDEAQGAAPEGGGMPAAMDAQQTDDQADKSYLRPVQGIDQALQVARELIMQTMQQTQGQASTDMQAGFAGQRSASPSYTG